MSPTELNALLRRRPFLPFRLHLTGGEAFEVRVPETTVVGMTTLFHGQRRNVQSEFFDEPILVAIRHITHVEPIVADEPAAV